MAHARAEGGRRGRPGGRERLRAVELGRRGADQGVRRAPRGRAGDRRPAGGQARAVPPRAGRGHAAAGGGRGPRRGLWPPAGRPLHGGARPVRPRRRPRAPGPHHRGERRGGGARRAGGDPGGRGLRSRVEHARHRRRGSARAGPGGRADGAGCVVPAGHAGARDGHGVRHERRRGRRRPLAASRDPLGGPPRRDPRAALPRAAARARRVRRDARANGPAVPRERHADRREREGADRPPEHDAPPAGALPAAHGRRPAQGRRPGRGLVGAAAPAGGDQDGFHDPAHADDARYRVPDRRPGWPLAPPSVPRPTAPAAARAGSPRRGCAPSSCGRARSCGP